MKVVFMKSEMCGTPLLTDARPARVERTDSPVPTPSVISHAT